MMIKVNGRLSLVARLLALAALFALLSASAAGQCASPIFNAGQNVTVGMRAGNIAAGDLNGDDRADFVVTNGNSTFISLILGTADGAPVMKKLEVGSAQGLVALGDLNNDGKLDLVTRQGSSVAVRLGNGLGGFGPASTTSVAVNGSHYAMLLADFNGDSKLDVFLANASYSASTLIFGNGSGGLGPVMTPLTNVMNAETATAGDFNHDDKVDLAVAASGGPVYLSLGDGAGHFGEPKEFAAGDARYLQSADFNKDGNLDFVAAGGSNLYVRLGDGAGGFGATKTFNSGGGALAVAVVDMNGDGKPDLVPAGNKSVGVLLGLGDGSFGPAASSKLDKYPLGVAVGDFNGDGKPDVGTVNQAGMRVIGAIPSTASVLLGVGAGKLASPSLLNVGTGPISVTGADFNNDGKTDLAVTSLGSNNVAVLRGNGLGGFGSPILYPVGANPIGVTAGDLNGDGKLDLITTNGPSHTVSVLLNTGAGFRPRTDLEAPWSGAANTRIGDFNNDGKADLVIGYAGNDSVSVLLGDGLGGFGPATGYTIPYGGHDLAVNDFNRDGHADLAVTFEGGFAVLPGDGSGGFGKTASFSTDSYNQSLAVGDFNGDGKADIAAGSIGNETVSIFLGNGLGGFTRLPSLTGVLGFNSVAAADFNNDGKQDLATAQTDGVVSLFLGKGTGGFAPPLPFITGGAIPRTLAVADFNADGRPDLAVTNQKDTFNDPPPVPPGVSVMLNKCAAPPAPVPSLSVAGDLEVAEGNTGTVNATFTVNLSAASSRPVTVSYYAAGRDATSGADFKGVAGKLVFAAGELSKSVIVPVNGDTLNEVTESFDLFLVYPLNAQIGRGRARATILDNDPPPTVSVNNISQPEGTTPAVFNVSLSKASGKTVTVKYVTVNGTAVAPGDYTAKALTTLTFAPGQTTQEVAVAVRGDKLDEPDETFKLVLSSPTNATLGAGTGICAIVDDDPLPSITVSNATVTEPDAGTIAASFIVKLSAASSQTVTVKYVTANGTTNPATAGADYTAAALTTLTFSPGQVSKTVTVQVQSDLLKEANETFFLNLSAATNAAITDAQGLGAILNDD